MVRERADIMIWKKIDVQGDCHHILWKAMKYVEQLLKQVYITSIRDGVHSITSFHYIGRAIDFKRSGKNKKQLREAVNKFCRDYQIPEQDFDIIEYPELDIFHLEYDPK